MYCVYFIQHTSRYNNIITINLIVFLITYTYLFVVFIDSVVPDPLICPNDCGKMYYGQTRKGSLTRHLKLACGVPKKFSCLLCNKKFSRKDNARKHVVNIHNKCHVTQNNNKTNRRV